MPGHRGPGPLGRAGRPGSDAEPAAPSVFISQDVAAGTAGQRAKRVLQAAAEFIADPAAVRVAKPAAEYIAGPGAQRVLARARTSAHGPDELHNEPERRG